MLQCTACSCLTHNVPYLSSATAIKMSTDYQNILRTFPRILSRLYDSRLFSCHFIGGGDSIEGQLVNFQVPEIVIALHMYLCASFHCSDLQMYSAFIMNKGVHNCNQPHLDSGDSECHKVNGQLTKADHLKYIARRCRESFGGLKTGIKRTPSKPPAYGTAIAATNFSLVFN